MRWGDYKPENGRIGCGAALAVGGGPRGPRGTDKAVVSAICEQPALCSSGQIKVSARLPCGVETIPNIKSKLHQRRVETTSRAPHCQLVRCTANETSSSRPLRGREGRSRDPEVFQRGARKWPPTNQPHTPTLRLLYLLCFVASVVVSSSSPRVARVCGLWQLHDPKEPRMEN